MEERRQITSRNWLISFIYYGILFGAFLLIFVFLVDPCCKYRVVDHKFFFFERYVEPGLITNYEYDTLIIGSSMVQNFDMTLVQERMGVSPLLIGVSGMRATDLTKLIKKSEEKDHRKTYYICVDLDMFLSDSQLIPEYLYRDDIISKCKYATSYEAWFRFIPMDVGVSILKKMGYNVTERFMAMDINRFSNWSYNASFGKNRVIGIYLDNKQAVSEYNNDNIEENMQARMNRFIEELNFNCADYVFFFPPYSALWWYRIENNGLGESYYDLKKDFVNKVSDKAVVYDFQYADLTLDLDNYRDPSHYSPEINDWMVEQFVKREYTTAAEDIETHITLLKRNIKKFREENQWLFE